MLIAYNMLKIFANIFPFSTPNNYMVKCVPVPVFLFEYILTVGYCNIHACCLKNNGKLQSGRAFLLIVGEIGDF